MRVIKIRSQACLYFLFTLLLCACVQDGDALKDIEDEFGGVASARWTTTTSKGLQTAVIRVDDSPFFKSKLDTAIGPASKVAYLFYLQNKDKLRQDSRVNVEVYFDGKTDYLPFVFRTEELAQVKIYMEQLIPVYTKLIQKQDYNGVAMLHESEYTTQQTPEFVKKVKEVAEKGLSNLDEKFGPLKSMKLNGYFIHSAHWNGDKLNRITLYMNTIRESENYEMSFSVNQDGMRINGYDYLYVSFENSSFRF